jgi:hypothetical protein
MEHTTKTSSSRVYTDLEYEYIDSKQRSMNTIILKIDDLKDILKQYPNDTDLGNFVRTYVNKHLTE